MRKPYYVVSACLAGTACRYDGGSNPCPEVLQLVREGLAGLPVPRPACELKNGRVLSRDGRDMTTAFLRGAQRALEIAQTHGCTAAVLKSRSPSCGFGQIYDGSFKRRLCAGQGLWAQLLRQAGLALYSEESLPPTP